MQLLRSAAKLALIISAISARCGACSIVYSTVQVGPNFRVRVEDHGRPVDGLRVGIRNEREAGWGAFADTDKNGFALFRGVPPGAYHLRADHDAGIPDGAELEVRRHGPAGVTVPLKWPNLEPIRVRSLKGRLHRPDELTGQSQAGLSIDLLEGKSGRRLRSLDVTGSGEFDFKGAGPGLYFLGLKAAELIAIAVDRNAPTDHLDIDFGWTSCGLWYVDRSKCPRNELQLGQLSGRVLDDGGAAIPNATIVLFDSRQTQVERLQSDSAGKFSSPHSMAGTYELAVSAAGFTPLHSTVHAESNGAAAHLPLTVRLGLLGNCSTADSR